MHRFDGLRRDLLGTLAAGALLPCAQARTAARSGVRSDRLPAELAARLRASGLPLESFGLLVQTVDSGQTWASWQADTPFTLASTAKVITSLCALSVLGPAFKWETRAFLKGTVRRGALFGDLRIVGGGDPLLDSEQMALWFRRMRGQGLDRIVGNMVLDHGRFALSDQDFSTTPEPAPERPHHVRPDALVLNEGVVRLALNPGARGYSRVALHPATPGPLPQYPASVAASCGPEIRWQRDVRRYDVRRSSRPVGGSLAPQCSSSETRLAPPAAAETTQQALAALWRVQGGDLRGQALSVSDVRASSGWSRPWSTLRSQSLGALIQEMNKHSNNLIARHLMLSLSAGFPRLPATLASAHQRMLAWLQQEGVPAGGIGVDSGSGLSRLERGTPTALVHLLRRAQLGPHASLFRDSLPIAGVDGTLEHRMRGGAAQGRASLKTGTLLDTRALTGYVQTRRGTQLAVAVLANHDTLAAQATPALDACIEWLAASNA